MRTSVEAKQARPLNLSSFKHITPVSLLTFDPDGLLFDGALTDVEIGDVWWFATSVDDADQNARAELAALLADARAANINPTTEDLHALLVALTDYVLNR